MKELETELNLEHVLFLRDDLTEQRCEHVTTVLTISHCSGHSTQQTTGRSVFLLRKPVDTMLHLHTTSSMRANVNRLCGTAYTFACLYTRTCVCKQVCMYMYA